MNRLFTLSLQHKWSFTNTGLSIDHVTFERFRIKRLDINELQFRDNTVRSLYVRGIGALEVQEQE